MLIGRIRCGPRLAITTGEGWELSFRHAAAGDLFGDNCCTRWKPWDRSRHGLTRVIAYVLERNAFRGLWSTRPGISAGVIAFLCRRLRETNSQLEAIALHPLEVWLARFLLFALGSHEAAPGNRVSLKLGFWRGELARLLGASRPNVNTALGALGSAGAIKPHIGPPFL